jgi:hypothetical protein
MAYGGVLGGEWVRERRERERERERERGTCEVYVVRFMDTES